MNVPDLPVVDFACNHRVTRRKLCLAQAELASSYDSG